MAYASLQGWLELEAAAKSGPVSSFGTKLGVILDFYLSAWVIWLFILVFFLCVVHLYFYVAWISTCTSVEKYAQNSWYNEENSKDTYASNIMNTVVACISEFLFSLSVSLNTSFKITMIP